MPPAAPVALSGADAEVVGVVGVVGVAGASGSAGTSRVIVGEVEVGGGAMGVSRSAVATNPLIPMILFGLHGKQGVSGGHIGGTSSLSCSLFYANKN
jgi:hypothetical protein